MKYYRSFAALAALFLPALLTCALPAGTAAQQEVEWRRVNIPAEGESAGWVLAPGSDIRHLTRAADGTLYCYATPAGTNHRLFKSTDSGESWYQTGGVQDTLVDIFCAPDAPAVLYYATSAAVYRSTDAGQSFTALPGNPGDAGTGNREITTIAATRQGTGNIVAASIRDTDAGEYGGVYILNEEDLAVGWQDTGIGNLDASCVAYSPRHLEDGQLLAVATDETDCLVLARMGDGDWGATVTGAIIPDVVPQSAALGFVDDYYALTEGAALFLALDTGSGDGDVYRIALAANSLAASDLDAAASAGLVSMDVSCIAVAGSAAGACLLAGAAAGTEILTSSNGGTTWAASTRQPTGESVAGVLLGSSPAAPDQAFAVTTGADSAFSLSTDGGTTWREKSLIDAKISAITGLEICFGQTASSTLFMLTHDGQHVFQSLWRSVDEGAHWERLMSSSASGIDEITRVAAEPSQMLYLAGTASGAPALWVSNDGGRRFNTFVAPLAVDAWACTPGAVFIGGYDGSQALVYRFTGTGFTPVPGVAAGSQPLTCLAISPGYAQDQTVLAGNATGQVYWSRDGGASFFPLGQQLPLVNGIGEVSLTFDPAFLLNGYVYAATSAPVTAVSSERIFRMHTASDHSWEPINGVLPEDTSITQVAVSVTGVLYAVDSEPVDQAEGKGGLRRSLHPAFPLGQTFEPVTDGLADGTTLEGIEAHAIRLWSVDSQGHGIVNLADSLCAPVAPESPADGAAPVPTESVILQWSATWGATRYQWQVDHDGNFSSVPAGFEGTTGGVSARLPALEPNTRYYWRVRVTEPLLSPWSPRYSFTTALAGTASSLELLSPAAGAAGVGCLPVFQWCAIPGADSYELLVSEDFLFQELAISRQGPDSLPTNAWRSDITLDHETTYYWKMRGCSGDSYSEWSAVSAFTTQAAPPSASGGAEPHAGNPGEPEEASAGPEEQNPSPSPEEKPQAPDPANPGTDAPPANGVEQDSNPKSLSTQAPVIENATLELAVPEWLSYALVALLSCMVLLLVVLIVLVARTRQY